MAPTWLGQLLSWYDQAAADDRIVEPNAMQVATAEADGTPDVRTVLARGFDDAGVVFYTNYDSVKGRQLAANPRAAAVFGWLPAERQVRFRGPVTRVSRAETEAYFASRQRLDDLLAEVTDRFGDDPIPPPPDWGGYRIGVTEMEFWQGRQFRLHDRLRYRRDTDGEWVIERLAP